MHSPWASTRRSLTSLNRSSIKKARDSNLLSPRRSFASDVERVSLKSVRLTSEITVGGSA
eukprot:Awhi_evm1s8468